MKTSRVQEQKKARVDVCDSACWKRWILFGVGLCVGMIYGVGTDSVAWAQEQCGMCLTDAWCASNTIIGAVCGAEKNRCHPRSNVCVVCLNDSDCKNGQVCSSSNTCVASTCPDSCNSDFDCLQAACGTRTRCLQGACADVSDAAGCQPPNLVVVLDNSGSMATLGSALVDTRQPCTQKSDCLTHLQGQTPPHTPVYDYACKTSVMMGINTCHFTRWDVAVSSLKRVISEYGGSTKATYKDRRIRFSLVLFNSEAQLSAPIFRDPPELINVLNLARAGGGTRYDLAFRTVQTHFQDVLPKDVVQRRKTAILFVTDGEPNEGCTASPILVNDIYNMKNNEDVVREIKTYVVGFGSGLSTSAKTCLTQLAQSGRTDAKRCSTGSCLNYYAADSADSLLDSFQDIINNATEEVCDGLDNDCDGLIDNRADGTCQCVQSRTGLVSSLPAQESSPYQQGVRLYTFLSSYDDQGTCPMSGTTDGQAIKQYNEACRNRVSQATSCTSSTNEEQPAGDAYAMYCNRCCGSTWGNSSGSQTCSWPKEHACESASWAGATGCVESCTNWCQEKKILASNCNMPRGYLRRSGTGYDSLGALTVLSSAEFGEDMLNKQAQRWLFTLLPGVDPRAAAVDQRPQIADVSPDNYQFPTPAGTSWNKPSSGWASANYQFSVSNENLTAAMLGISPQTCSGADCTRDRKETIGLILGYDEEAKTSLRVHRLGAIYHSTPIVVPAPRRVLPDPGYQQWLDSTTPTQNNNTYKVSQRPTVVYVGSNDGIMHAFHAETGLELWGYIPQSILPRLRVVTNGSQPEGGRVYTVDGSPVVENVQMYRYFDATTQSFVSQWKTVLLFGLRAGGRGYTAIDVTNPYRPRLLWEIHNQTLKDPSQPTGGTFDRLAYTYAKPLIVHMSLMWDGRLQERAVAVLAGGIGLEKKGSAWVINQTDPTQGGIVYFVDIETGRCIREMIPADAEQGIPLGRERGIAATPIGISPLPGITDRIFVADVNGRIFRLDVSAKDPILWNVRLFYDLFTPQEFPNPVMTAPAFAYNQRGEVVLFGGTGDLQNLGFIQGVNKLFSLREKISYQSETEQFSVIAVPNYVSPLHKIVQNENSTNPGAEATAQSLTGERLTATPTISNGTAYFHTYTPSTNFPICGVSGYSRIYGIHFDASCRSQNCYPMSQGPTPHSSHQVSSYVQKERTPLKCCEADNACAVGDDAPPSDTTMITDRTTCGDLNYTLPMLQENSTAQPYQYLRYLSLGANTLSMGTQLVFQPGHVSVQRSTQNNTVSHNFTVHHPGQTMIAFQIAGRYKVADDQFSLARLRAIQPSSESSLRSGIFPTLRTDQTTTPINIASWGSLLD